MSFLQNLTTSIQQNVLLLEGELAAMRERQPQESMAATADLSPFQAEPSLLEDAGLSTSAFQLTEKLRADVKALESALTPTRVKLATVALAQIKSKALQAAAELGLSDAIERLGGEAELSQLAKACSVHPNKLAAVLRILAGEHIYTERRPGVFANSRHSIGLLNTVEGAQPMLSFLTRESFAYTAGHYDYLTRDGYRDSFEANKSPFSISIGQDKDFGQYLMDPSNSAVAAKVVSGVVPWLNQITRPGLLHDYPWQDLGPATVVDFGAGPGDVGLDVLRTHPRLRWIFQDLPQVVDAQRSELEKQLSAAGARDRAEIVAQDYFEPNISIGDVFFMRGVIREYDDETALQVLRQAAVAMKGRPHTRLVINELCCASPALVADVGSRQPVSELIPHDQSPQSELANLMAMMATVTFGGRERDWTEMKALLERAGLVPVKLFRLRTFPVVIECKLVA